MGTRENPSRFDAMGKALPDEPYFVLLARDHLASKLVREWATQRHSEGDAGEIIMEALSCAADMDKWRIKHGHRTFIEPQENG